tara:strand:+ start:1030 stop:2787 length:1758 start_codon:yes stop_codon:yes gene_type:complete
MGGGLLQLSITGKEDTYLVNNPNINFFKAVYMRYTNFSMTSIEVPCVTFNNIYGPKQKGKSLSYNKPSIFKVKIPRNGDLLNNIMFRFDLPDIYSDYRHLEGFKYIDNIGSAIIKKASLYIENTLIETITGEFLYAYHTLHQSKSKNDLYSIITGNKSELTDPMGNIDKSYRKSTKNGTYFYKRPDGDSGPNAKTYLRQFYNTMPSITSNTISVPLSFWFSRISGLALPLVALQKHRVYIEFELRPFNELFTIIKKEAFNDDTMVNYFDPVGHDNIHTFGIKRYYNVTPENDITSKIFTTTFISDGWDFRPRLDINYIFLDNKERLQFVNNPQTYLIEQVNNQHVTNVVGSNTIAFKLYHPVKEIIIIPSRSDIKERNQWLNFTNLDDNKDERDYINYQTKYFYDKRIKATWLKSHDDYIIDLIKWYSGTARPDYLPNELRNLVDIWNYRPVKKIPTIHSESDGGNNPNHDKYTANIIESLEIYFNNSPRLANKPVQYFNKNQIHNHYNGMSVKGILAYSFSKHPGEFQPYGSCNMSEIKNMIFNITLKKPPEEETYKYNLSTYFINYNVLDIRNGMGSLVYSTT